MPNVAQVVHQENAVRWLSRWNSLMKRGEDPTGGELGIDEDGNLFVQVTYRSGSVETYTFNPRTDPIMPEMKEALESASKLYPDESEIYEKIGNLLSPPWG